MINNEEEMIVICKRESEKHVNNIRTSQCHNITE